ncbi:MAG: HAD-IIIA family hydrolase [candidate division Zixibacteria bacterium]|nr:HAD-IIIA family hydrolase [candidate division Zixibacteria bacterium]
MQQRILVVRFGSLGDVLLTSAFLINLRIHFPAAHIVFLTKERFRTAVELLPEIDQIATLPANSGLWKLLATLIDIEREGFDILFDLHSNTRSWLTSKIIRAGKTIVYPKRSFERRKIVRTQIIPNSWPHTIDLYNDCLLQLGKIPFCKRPNIRRSFEYVPALSSAKRPSQTVIIAPGAAHANKQWPVEKFAETAKLIHERSGAHIIWVTTRAEAGKSTLEKFLPPTSFSELIDAPLTTLKDLIAQAGLTIANDSGLMHLSSALGTPTIGIFGPTHPALGFSPRGPHDLIIETDEFCRPCSLHGKTPCWRPEQFCFTRILPHDVAQSAIAQLNKLSALAPVVFIDRDGTLIVNKHYLSDPAQVELENGAVEALHLATQKGYKIVVVSNQSGVARGYFTIENVEAVNDRLRNILASNGITLDGLYYCPHYPSTTSLICDCRKPSAGMAEGAVQELGVELRRSIVIGDTIDDMNFAKVIGARSILVRTGYGTRTEAALSNREVGRDIEVVFSILDAIKLI